MNVYSSIANTTMTARPYFLMTTGLAQAASGNRPNPFFASLADVLWMEADAKLNVAQPTVLHKPMPLPPSAVFRTLARVGGSGKIPSLPSSVGLAGFAFETANVRRGQRGVGRQALLAFDPLASFMRAL